MNAIKNPAASRHLHRVGDEGEAAPEPTTRISWVDRTPPSSDKQHRCRGTHAASVQGARDGRPAVAGSEEIMRVSRVPARAWRVRRGIALRWCRHEVSQPRSGRIRNSRSRMSPSPQPIASTEEPDATGRATKGSDETLVDVAPSPCLSRPESSGHRVVGLLVVRPGVPVRRVIRTGHPAAGQADDKARLAVRAVPAVPAVIGLRRGARKAVEVLTSRGRPVRAYGRRV
jgi:hypothetical protein